MRVCGWILLAVWTLAVLAATLPPLEYEWQAANPRSLKFEVGKVEDLVDIMLNVALFLPLGVLAAAFPPTGWSRRKTKIAVLVAACAFSLAIEVVQQFNPVRDSSLMDLVSNTAGAALGFRLRGFMVRQRFERSSELTPWQSATIVAGAAIAILAASYVLQSGVRTDAWDDTFFLTIGNERSGDRPWRGRIYRAELSDRETSQAVFERFAEGDSSSVRKANLVSYTPEGTMRAPNVAPLRWTGLGDGSQITPSSWLEPDGPSPAIAQRIRRSNQFTVRLDCSSDENRQGGPARVLSYSRDATEQNLIVGQENAELVVRFRTLSTSPDGTKMPIVIPDVFADGQRRDILISYGGSTLRIAVAGRRQVHTMEFSPGAILATYYLFPYYRLFTYYKMAYYVSVYLFLGAVLTLSASRTSAYYCHAAILLAIFPLLLELALARATGRPFQWLDWIISVAVGAAGLPTARAMLTIAGRIVGKCASEPRSLV